MQRNTVPRCPKTDTINQTTTEKTKTLPYRTVLPLNQISFAEQTNNHAVFSVFVKPLPRKVEP